MINLATGCQLATDRKTIIYQNQSNGKWVRVGELSVNGEPQYTQEFATFYKAQQANLANNQNGFGSQVGLQPMVQPNNNFQTNVVSTNNPFANTSCTVTQPVSQTAASVLLNNGGNREATTSVNIKPEYKISSLMYSGENIAIIDDTDIDEVEEIITSSTRDFIAKVNETKNITITSDITEDMIGTLTILSGIAISVCPNLESAIDDLFNDIVIGVSVSNYTVTKADLAGIDEKSFGGSNEAHLKYTKYKESLDEFFRVLKSILKPTKTNDVIIFPTSRYVLGACSEGLKEEISSIDTIQEVRIPDTAILYKLLSDSKIIHKPTMVRISGLKFRIDVDKKIIQIKEVL